MHGINKELWKQAIEEDLMEKKLLDRPKLRWEECMKTLKRLN